MQNMVTILNSQLCAHQKIDLAHYLLLAKSKASRSHAANNKKKKEPLHVKHYRSTDRPSR